MPQISRKLTSQESVEKKVKHIKREYAYLNALPPEGWMWEFVRRSPDYRKAFREMEIRLT